MAWNKNSSSEIPKSFIEKALKTKHKPVCLLMRRAIEIYNDEENAPLVWDKADSTPDLFVVNFRRGWISVYPKYGELLECRRNAARDNLYKGEINTEVMEKTA